MSTDPVKNFAIALVSPVGYGTGDTAVALQTGYGALFPLPATDGAFNLVWWNFTDYPNPADDPNVEIVRCTARSTDALTVTRHQESTNASSKNTAGKVYKMMLAPTKKTIDDIVALIATKQDALGYTAEDVSNKDTSTSLGTSETKYPSQKAVKTYVDTGLALKESLANKGAANGYTPLDANSLIPSAYLPPIAITDTFVVSSQAAMLALTAQTGDVAVRTDTSTTYILQGTDPTILANWVLMRTPTDAVLSVNGQTGVVSLTTGNISEGSNLYFTQARAIASPLTGYVSGAGTVASTDSILQAIQKLNGNIGALVTGVSSVTGADTTLTVSPTSGAVTVAINLAKANTWTGVATFTPAARASGVSPYFQINASADTGITANTEARGVHIIGATRTWIDGTVPNQSEYYFGTPTYNKTTTAATFTQAQTAYFGAAPIAGTGVTITNGYSAWFHGNVHIGTQLGGSPFAPIGGTGLEVSDSNTTVAGQQIGLTNTSNSVHAFSGYAMFNDLANGSAYTHYAGAFYNSSTFNDTAFGTAFAVANQLSFYGTDGPTLIGTLATGASAYLNVVIGGAATLNEVARFTTTGLTVNTNGLGTSQTATSGMILQNTTNAAVGAQQISPAQHFFGKGWATNAGGSSQPVEMAIDMLPVQGAASPSATMRILFSANGGAYTTPYLFNSGGGFTCSSITTNSAGTQSLGGVTLNIGGNGTTTTANILGGATVNTAISTVNINQGATASGGTKVTNISTQGLAGSTTTIAIGSAFGTSTTTLNGQVVISDTVNLAIGTTTGTKIGTATSQKIGFWNATPVIQQVLTAYTTNSQASAYTGIDNAQAGSVYAKLTDLNALRVAYENARAAYDDLRTLIKNTGVLA